MTMIKLPQAIWAKARKAADGEFKLTEEGDGVILFLLVSLLLSLFVVVVADEIERRHVKSTAVSDKWALENGEFVNLPFPTPNASIRDSHTQSAMVDFRPPSPNHDRPTMKELDDLVDDVAATRQFDEIMKYDKFLKLLKS